MSTYETHCQTLLDDTMSEYWWECYEQCLADQREHYGKLDDESLLRRHLQKVARDTANARVIDQLDRNQEIASDWMR